MPELVALEFTDPAGEVLRVEWDGDALADLVAPAADVDPAWRLRGELDWDEVEGLRILSGRLGPERLLTIASLRPKGAQGHGEEVVAGTVGDATHFDQLEEVLLSTEYGPDGAVRRIGLELHRDEAVLPLRVAGDVVARNSQVEGGVRRDTAAFELRGGGDEGVAILDVLTTAP
jgi:hypothetical protein